MMEVQWCTFTALLIGVDGNGILDHCSSVSWDVCIRSCSSSNWVGDRFLNSCSSKHCPILLHYKQELNLRTNCLQERENDANPATNKGLIVGYFHILKVPRLKFKLIVQEDL